MNDLISLARRLVPVVRAAGDIELKYYREGAEIIDKMDGSPVTLADREAEVLIAAALAEIAPDIPMVGEEAVEAGTIPDISSGTFFLVDPLDGTKEFITGGGDFTVNIALIRDFQPVMGIIYAPVSDALYLGADDQAFKSIAGGTEEPIRVRASPPEGLTVVESKRHGDPEAMAHYLHGRTIAKSVGRSSSLKFCVIAAGEADIYPRLGPTSEWDIAAGQAILHAAGGRVTTLDGKPMPYGKSDKRFLNGMFVAVGDVVV